MYTTTYKQTNVNKAQIKSTPQFRFVYNKKKKLQSVNVKLNIKFY